MGRREYILILWRHGFFFLNGVGIRSRKQNSRHTTRECVTLSRKFLEGHLKKVSRGWATERERDGGFQPVKFCLGSHSGECGH